MTLSQRIAQLTGPDRAVDAEVAVALGWVRHCRDLAYCAGYDEWWEKDGVTAYDIPAFTGSLDIAMSAVPEGMRVRIDIREDGRGGAWVYWPTEVPPALTDLRATPEIALLSAAMMARGL